MRYTFIFIMLYLFSLSINAQDTEKLISNNWYFSQSDTLFFSQIHIKTNKVKLVKEYRTDKKYADIAQLMSEYSFDALGSLTHVKTYDIHGTPSSTEFKVNTNGTLTEVWIERNGTLSKTQENTYRDTQLIKHVSYYGEDYYTSKEYDYLETGLLSSILYLRVKETKGTRLVITYDSLKRPVSELVKNPGDSIGFGYSYKYDNLGRKFYTEYKEATLNWIETTDYSKSTGTTIVAKIYSENKLTEIITKKNNQHGLIEVCIRDERTSVKKTRRKNNMFCGYSGRPNYQKMMYKYDSQENRISEKEYLSPHKVSKQTNCTYDDKGNLITKIIFINSKRDSEWAYSYN